MIKTMAMTVEKRIEFDVQELAADVVDKLYDTMEYGVDQDDWRTLTQEQQKILVLAVLTEAVRKETEGE